jgi:molybdopterin/thiamine biosynthesis adenylyltransferase/rhodanese-related sulfurtransferase
MDQQDLLRYSRHFLLTEIGSEGQAKLKKAKVLVVGAGGLGSPIALYLAAAGVGRLSILDFDTVDLSNLQRQVLYTTEQIGKSKAECAKERLLALNPGLEILALNERLTKENALALFASHDVIADGADNFLTRYLSNDAAVLTGKPLVSASILGFEGQLAVFHHLGGPCYRCLYPEPPPAGQVPSCSENGVLGVLPGVMGCLQATEVLKVILGIGETLHKHLLYFDALRMDFQKMQTTRNESCAVCGNNPTIKELKDTMPEDKDPFVAPQMSVKEADQRLKKGEIQLVDLRDDSERAICRIPGATHIPFNELEKRLGELAKDKPVVFHCKGGGRATRAVKMLAQKGMPSMNLTGGILGWIDEIDPKQTKY